MAREPRITTRCPKCEKRWLRVKEGGPCGGLERFGVVCDGTVEAVPPNAPRDPSGKPRVPMTVRVLEDTSKVLTATDVAALADGHERQRRELEEWAKKRAPQLDDEGRAWTMSDHYCHEWLEAVVPHPKWASVPELKEALRAQMKDGGQ